uniref:Uncharacterized protein n=1 Tax=Vespula pensylvanica TaxID=30213 RepID=A0A834KUW5_VESPE|nr:hypothetical protein H0235_013138 [Vespula pensylvanica]
MCSERDRKTKPTRFPIGRSRLKANSGSHDTRSGLLTSNANTDGDYVGDDKGTRGETTFEPLRTSLTNQRAPDVKRYYYAALASRCITMIDDVGSKLSTIRLRVRNNICVIKGEFRVAFEDADDKRTKSNKSERVHHRIKAEGASRLSRSSNKVARMLLPTSALTITSFLRTYSDLDVAKALGN